MKTFFPSVSEVTRNWHIIDAKGQTLGKLAVVVANVLRGKNKATYTPYLDTGDFVIIINAKHLAIPASKMGNLYYRHSGYFGHLKEYSLQLMMEKNPCRVIELAIRGMLPKNKMRAVFLKKLKVYPEAEHPHQAQKPLTLTVD